MTAKQTKNYNNELLTTIELGNTISRESADTLKKALNEETYMNFKVIAAPYGGGLTLTIETTYRDSKDEILGMLLGLMAEKIMDSKK